MKRGRARGAQCPRLLTNRAEASYATPNLCVNGVEVRGIVFGGPGMGEKGGEGWG